MKTLTALALVPFLLLAATGAEAACTYPQAPQSLPNGAKATKDEMLAAQTQVKEYASTVEQTYLPCLDQEKKEAVAALDNMDPEYTAKSASIDSIHAKKHNAALDELQALVDRWNTEKKAFAAQDAK